MTPLLAVDARMLHQSGIGTYLRNLLPRLAARLPEHRFVLLGREEETREMAARMGAATVECAAPIYSVQEQWALPRAVPVDAALLWLPHYPVPLRYRGRMAVTVHDLCHLVLGRLFGGPQRRLYARAMLHAVRRRADLVLTDSDFTAREFLRHIGRPRGTLLTVPLAAEDFWAEPCEPPPSSRPYFLYVGNVKPHKNVRGLLHAAALLGNRIPHDVVIVGRREGFLTGDPRVEEAARALGERVRFTGPVSDEALRGWYAGAEALVFPSLYEGFGLPALEAMAAGCPVLSSDRGSLPEVCGPAAEYFDPEQPERMAEAMARVASDPTLRNRLRELGDRRWREFSWDRAADGVAAALEEAAAR
jgi:glycosyltransferase involved in cell wall biosynthesis